MAQVSSTPHGQAKQVFDVDIERAKRGNLFAAPKPSVRGYDATLTVFREMCDIKPVRMRVCALPAQNRIWSTGYAYP